MHLIHPGAFISSLVIALVLVVSPIAAGNGQVTATAPSVSGPHPPGPIHFGGSASIWVMPGQGHKHFKLTVRAENYPTADPPEEPLHESAVGEWIFSGGDPKTIVHDGFDLNLDEGLYKVRVILEMRTVAGEYGEVDSASMVFGVEDPEP